MSLSIYNVKKWRKMLTGKSVLHVNQDMGKSFVPGEIKGYFNNLTEKVTKNPDLLNTKELPLLHLETGANVEFAVGIFQYGLGAYDLFLQSGEEKYLKKFFQCVEWCVAQQMKSGALDNFSFRYPQNPYGAMCQGEAASLLVRAFVETRDKKYVEAAKKSIDFMLIPVENGGTTRYAEDDVILLEYTHLSAVLNGWVFAAFGLYDLAIISGDEKYKGIFEKTVNTMSKYLEKFDNGYWSLYSLDGKITSPFYHNLHIAQMHALHLATKKDIFKDYEEKWIRYKKSWLGRKRAFIKKAWQKIIEK